jgi:hypothetical protein
MPCTFGRYPFALKYIGPLSVTAVEFDVLPLGVGAPGVADVTDHVRKLVVDHLQFIGLVIPMTIDENAAR